MNDNNNAQNHLYMNKVNRGTLKDYLIRQDERSRNTWRMVEKIDRRVELQNGYIKENLQNTATNTAWRKGTIWFLGIFTPLVISGFIYLIVNFT